MFRSLVATSSRRIAEKWNAARGDSDQGIGSNPEKSNQGVVLKHIVKKSFFRRSLKQGKATHLKKGSNFSKVHFVDQHCMLHQHLNAWSTKHATFGN